MYWKSEDRRPKSEEKKIIETNSEFSGSEAGF